jgi:hypothetical protein
MAHGLYPAMPYADNMKNATVSVATSTDRCAAALKAWVTRRAAAHQAGRTAYLHKLRISMRGAIALARMRQAKRAADGRTAVAVTVKVDELMAKLAENNYCCAVSGLPFYADESNGSFGPSRPSLDRIDADGEYSAENVRVVYLGINGLRGRGSDADVLRIAQAIVAKAGGARLKRPA